MALHSFDPDDVIVTLDGLALENIGPDGVTLSTEYDIHEVEDGINGDISVSRNRRNRGTLSISLLTASDEDAALDQLRGLTTFDYFAVTVTIKSLNKAIATIGWYQQAPDLVVNTQAPARTHVLGLQNASLSLIDSASGLINDISSAL